jgi:drug/metabolite transporter (DMT)-like permease
MRIIDACYLLLYALTLTLGNLLFKVAALRARNVSADRFLLSLGTNPSFIIAALIYGALAFFWVWILTRVPLSTAYPFVFTTFVFVPLLSYLFFGEKIGASYVLGALLIAGGVSVILWRPF